MKIVGYARTSTVKQDAGLEAQIRDLQQFRCSPIFSEQISSAETHRPELEQALAALQPGDVLMVTKPDRLARNTQQLLTIHAELQARGVGLTILSMGPAPIGDGNPTAKLVLTILAGVATWEREIMLERQAEGIAKAQREGKYKGEAPSVHIAPVLALAAEGLTQKAIARRLGISLSTIARVMRRRASGSGLVCAA